MIRLLRSTKTEGDDRWRKLSRVLTEALIPLLAAQKIHLENKSQMDLLHKIFASLAPGTLRPVDPLLSAVLTCTVDLTNLTDVQRWLGFIVLALPILTNQSPEEAILSRLDELGILMINTGSYNENDVIMGTSLLSMDSSTTSTMSDLLSSNVKPEVTLAKFLIQAIGAACTKFHQLAYSQWTEATTSFLQQELSHLLLFVIYMFQSGRYYRVTRAAQQLAKHEQLANGNKSQMLYSLHFITEMFIQLAHVAPFITLQWIYILKLMNHSAQNLWSKILQPEQRNLVMYKPSSLESDCLNYEVTRKGGLVLLCDYLCENLSNADQTTWLVVNYVQNLVASIKESPVQDFVMSVHRSSSSSGLLLQAVISRLSSVGDCAKVTFLKDALTVVENVHPAHAGKLVSFLVHKYMVSPHLSLTRQANFIACARVEAMINSTKEEATVLISTEELASILEVLKKNRLTKRFGRLSTLLNRVASDYFDLSPISGLEDDLRTFNPTSIAALHLDREWLLGQIKVRCCHPDNLSAKSNSKNGLVCAQILSYLEAEDEILEIMTLKDFSVSILASCLSYDSKEKKALFKAAKKVLLSHLKTLTATLPRPFGLFKIDSWAMSNSDSRYSQWLESSFHSLDFVNVLHYLLPAVQVAFESNGLDDLDAEDAKALARFTVLAMELAKWVICDLTEEKIVQGCEETASLCLRVTSLALAHDRVSEYLSKDNHQGHGNEELWPTSICLCLNDIIEIRFSIIANQVPICSAFKVAFDDGQETATTVASIKLNELFSDLINDPSKTRYTCGKYFVPFLLLKTF
jgi:huntingtin